jgi:hypothetical protein
VKKKRIEVKDGSISVLISTFSDGRFCIDTLLGKTRKRITRSSLAAAKIEARKLIGTFTRGANDVGRS